MRIYITHHIILLHRCNYATPLGVYKRGELVIVWVVMVYVFVWHSHQKDVDLHAIGVAALPNPMGCLPPVTPSLDRAKEGCRW